MVLSTSVPPAAWDVANCGGGDGSGGALGVWRAGITPEDRSADPGMAVIGDGAVRCAPLPGDADVEAECAVAGAGRGPGCTTEVSCSSSAASTTPTTRAFTPVRSSKTVTMADSRVRIRRKTNPKPKIGIVMIASPVAQTGRVERSRRKLPGPTAPTVYPRR